jgi:hypothetical protein
MNYLSLGLSALGGTVASFAFGFLVMWLVPGLFEEVLKYPGVFRPKEEMMAFMPFALAGNLVAILVAAILWALIRPAEGGLAQAAGLGLLLGVLAACNVAHNYANLAIGARLALGQAAAYLVQWTVVGAVIGLIYRPAG